MYNCKLNNFKNIRNYRLYTDGSMYYHGVGEKQTIKPLTNLDQWLGLRNIYKEYPVIYNTLDNILKRPAILDNTASEIFDIGSKDDQPMLIIVRGKDNPENKVLAYACRTYLGKMDSRVYNITACQPIAYSESIGEVVTIGKTFHIANKKLRTHSGYFSFFQFGVWFNFKMLDNYDLETVICFFDIKEASKQPQTPYHAFYPQVKDR